MGWVKNSINLSAFNYLIINALYELEVFYQLPLILPSSLLDVNHGRARIASNMEILSVIQSPMGLDFINNSMKMN